MITLSNVDAEIPNQRFCSFDKVEESPSSPPAMIKQKSPKKKLNALVADDDQFCLQMEEAVLRDNSFKVKVAHEGNEAFKIFAQTHFDILFLDL